MMQPLSTLIVCGVTLVSSTWWYPKYTQSACDNEEVVRVRDGGSIYPAVTWHTQCDPHSDRAMVALYDRGAGGKDNWYQHGAENVDYMKCRGFQGKSDCVYEGDFVDEHDCHVIGTHGKEGGPYDAHKDWNVQCGDGKVMVAIYDDDDHFEDIDKVKCCKVRRPLKVETADCIARRFENQGSHSAGSKWDTFCPADYFVTALRGEAGNVSPKEFGKISDMKCCPVLEDDGTGEPPKCGQDEQRIYLTKNDGGATSESDRWNADCSKHSAINALRDDYSQFYQSRSDWCKWDKWMKCATYDGSPEDGCYDGPFVDRGDCEVIDTHPREGGANHPWCPWEMQCSHDKVMVALYDDNDHFYDVDKVKCCAVADELEVVDGECIAIAFEDCGSTDAELGKVWNTQCPPNHYFTAMRGERNGHSVYGRITDIKCCPVKPKKIKIATKEYH